MRALDRVDPRWVALLLVPGLLAAGAAQPEVVVPRAGAVLAQPAPVLLEHAAPAAAPVAAPAPETAVPPVPTAARREQRASRSVTRTARGPLTADERGRSALRALGYDAARLGYAVRFLPYRGGPLGTTNRREKLITVYVQPGQSELVLRTTIAHELGHALDFAHGTRQRREAYRDVRRLPAGPWFPCDRCSDLRSPAGDFAEVFAVWLAGPGDFRSRLAGPPTRAQLRELAPLFAVPGPSVAAREAAPSPSASPSPPPRNGLPALLGPPPTPAPRRG